MTSRRFVDLDVPPLPRQDDEPLPATVRPTDAAAASSSSSCYWRCARREPLESTKPAAVHGARGHRDGQRDGNLRGNQAGAGRLFRGFITSATRLKPLASKITVVSVSPS